MIPSLLKESYLTADYARSLLRYDQNTGTLYWLKPSKGRRKSMVAGCKRAHGYLVTNIDRYQYYNHRLAFLLMTGKWPVLDVDHKNGIRDDNCWSNLREVSKALNQQNMRTARRGNQSGLIGVSLISSGGYYSQIMTSGRLTHLGSFKTAEEAHAAYLEAKRRLHSTCTI